MLLENLGAGQASYMRSFCGRSVARTALPHLPGEAQAGDRLQAVPGQTEQATCLELPGAKAARWEGGSPGDLGSGYISVVPKCWKTLKKGVGRWCRGFPGGTRGKEPACQRGDTGDALERKIRPRTHA